jgi:hypothetical protein
MAQKQTLNAHSAAPSGADNFAPNVGCGVDCGVLWSGDRGVICSLVLRCFAMELMSACDSPITANICAEMQAISGTHRDRALDQMRR